MHTVSEGDGPVNALDGALRKALLPFYPRLAEMHLVDYKVRVVNARAETAARVRVVIEWRDGDGRLGHRRRQREHHRGELAGAGGRVEYKLFKDEDRINRRGQQSWRSAVNPAWHSRLSRCRDVG